MRSPFRSHAAGCLAAAALLVLTAGIASAAEAKPAASPAPTVIVTTEDVLTLKDNLRQLVMRFNAQSATIEENSKELSTIRKRVDDYLLPSTLEPLNKGLAEQVRRTNETKETLSGIADKQDRQQAELVAQLRELSGMLAQLQERVAQGSKQSADQLEKVLRSVGDFQDRVTNAAKAAPAIAPAPDPTARLVVAFFIGILLIGGLVIFGLQRQLRALQVTDARMTAAFAVEREALQQNLLAHLPAAPAGTENFTVLQAQMQELIGRLGTTARAQPSADAATTVIRPLVPTDEQTTLNLSTVTAGIPAAVCWTAAFFDPASPMARWREQIESHLTSPEYSSMPLLAGWLSLRAVCSRQPAPPLADVADAVAALSRTLHDYWEALPGAGEDELARASSEWIGAVKSLISSVAPLLEIREVLTGGRFDSDTMQTVREGPGNHLNVAAVFSWIILERTGERARILHRARIATT